MHEAEMSILGGCPGKPFQIIRRPVCSAGQTPLILIHRVPKLKASNPPPSSKQWFLHMILLTLFLRRQRSFSSLFHLFLCSKYLSHMDNYQELVLRKHGGGDGTPKFFCSLRCPRSICPGLLSTSGGGIHRQPRTL